MSAPVPIPIPARRAGERRWDDEAFLWGVATSADQHEGGLNGPGQPQNNWAWAERDNSVDPIGAAADFWNRAEADFARCRELGLNSFRLGLSWARIQPSTVLDAPDKALPPPPFDEAALARYGEILAGCRRAGLEPVLTLHHFTHPAWLGLDAWLKPETIDLFLAFVEKSMGALLDAAKRDGVEPPRFLITINEPNILASCTYFNGVFPGGERGLRPTFASLAHLLEAHVRAYRLLHGMYRERGLFAPRVSFNNYCSDLYWNDQGWLDLLFAPARGVPRERIFPYLWEQAWKLDDEFRRAKLPIRSALRRLSGFALKKIHHFAVYACSFDASWNRLLDLLYEDRRVPVDYLAIDYYDPFVAHALRWPTWHDALESHSRKPFHERLMDGMTNKWWDWRILPEGLAYFVRILKRFDLPILIAENGMATRSDARRHWGRRDNLLRSDFLRFHVAMVKKLKAEGAPIIGYMHWSLVDNYEWGTYVPRFGLFNREREAVDHRGDNPGRTYAELISS